MVTLNPVSQSPEAPPPRLPIGYQPSPFDLLLSVSLIRHHGTPILSITREDTVEIHVVIWWHASVVIHFLTLSLTAHHTRAAVAHRSLHGEMRLHLLKVWWYGAEQLTLEIIVFLSRAAVGKVYGGHLGVAHHYVLLLDVVELHHRLVGVCERVVRGEHH